MFKISAVLFLIVNWLSFMLQETVRYPGLRRSKTASGFIYCRYIGVRMETYQEVHRIFYKKLICQKVFLTSKNVS